MSVVKYLCYLCYNHDGEEVEATHKYSTGNGLWYTVCKEHYELAKQDGYETKKIETIVTQY